jgi:hypothetical protein
MHKNAEVERWFNAASHALASGGAAAVLSGLMLGWRSHRDEGSAAGGLNAPSQWLWGEQRARTRRFSVRHTVAGAAIHLGTSWFWGVLYERFLGGKRTSQISAARIAAEAAGATVAAYLVDYHLTPRRLQPGFEKHMSPASMALVYAGFAAGLTAATLAMRRRCSSQILAVERQPEGDDNRPAG